MGRAISVSAERYLITTSEDLVSCTVLGSRLETPCRSMTTFPLCLGYLIA